MSFNVYLKDEIGNQITKKIGLLPKIININILNIIDGFLIKGDYRIPIQNILFIQEV